MNEAIRQALENDRVIDITTIGRKSGQARKIEIWFHNIEENLYITGMPSGKRDWYANMVANPEITFHLKNSVQADISATVRPITENTERREIIAKILEKIERPASDVDAWVEGSPLVEVNLQDY